MITRIATASEYETSEAARHVAELQNVLLQMPPAQQAMGFAILSLVQETAATSTATVENADEIWRAARVFRQFLKLSKAGKAIVCLCGCLCGHPSLRVDVPVDYRSMK